MDAGALHEAGLTDGEAKVYLALLELGSSTTGPIVHKSGIARSIIYQILARLMDKGIVSSIIKEKTSYFQAAEPGRLLEYLDERERMLKKSRENVQALLPQLLLLRKSTTQSAATLYTGLRGIRTAHEHTYEKLRRGEEYVYLGVPAQQPEEQHSYWMKDHLLRIKAGITCRLFFNQDTDPEILRNRNSYAGAEARLMPADIITPAQLLIYKDTTVIQIQKPDPIAVEIINQPIADSFKAYFEEYWRKSAPFKG